MLMALDVGNTNIVIALYDGDRLRRSWRMSTDKNRSGDEMGMTLLSFLQTEGVEALQIDDVIISSVVPPIMHSLGNAVRRYLQCEPMIIGPGVKTGLNIRYDNPREVGADRIVNAVAAVKKYGAPVIIVDFGTATTYCAVDRKGDYIGGVITPGVQISLDALFERAAKLPRVEILKPDTLIGRNTVSAMQAGAVYGQIGQADYIVSRMREELGEPDCKAVATGGLANLIVPETETISEVDSMLTLDGLKLIYDKNKEN